MTPEGQSSEVPGLTLVWDMSRLSAYARDPLAFYWKCILGMRSVGFSSALTWGTLYHEATGYFEKQVFYGVDRETALRDAIRKLIPAALKERMPVQGAKGDAAKRNVRTLVRALVWFEAEYRDNPMPPIALADGTPAIEFNAVVPLDMKAPTGEDYLIVVNIDKIASDDTGAQFAIERKTTTQTLGKYFFQKYDPCFQTYTYDLVCDAMFPSTRLRGVTVEACQTAVEFARFERHPIVRTPGAREHWLKVIKYWIRRAERDALDNSWFCAMNTESSSYESVYREIQRRDPKIWNSLLAVDLSREPVWNPLVKRPPLIGE
jgi:hypothetical protein